MSDYTKITNYAAKDLLLHLDPAKAIKGTEVGAEFDAIATMSATKSDKNEAQTVIWCGTNGGTANAITLTPSTAISAYVAGQTFRFNAAIANTGVVTVSVSTLATKAIQASGNALSGGEIIANKIYELIYDGSAFQIKGMAAGETYTPAGTGAVATTVQGKLRESVSVKDFGAVGDGITDDTTAIQAAFNAYTSTPVTLVFPKGTYLVSAELLNKTNNILGEGFSTTIKASASAQSVVAMRGQQAFISNIFIDANGLTSYGVYIGDNINQYGTNSGLLSGVKVQGALLDGVYFSNQGNHNNFVIDRSLIWQNGTTYNTGTAATSGGTVATITGAADLTTFVRAMYDYIHVTGEALPRAIISVTTNTVTVNPAFNNTNTGLTYSIYQGSGVCIASHGDNSEIKIINSVLNTNAMAGLDDHALYGAESLNNVIETNSLFGRVIGRGGGTPHTPISAGDFRNYYEGHGFVDIRVEAGSNHKFDITGETSLALISLNTSDSTIATGLLYDGNGERFDTEIKPQVNIETLAASWGKCYVFTQAGAWPVVVNLPVPASTLETSFRQKMLSPITFITKESNAQTITFKSASHNINGVIGTTGITVSGSYKTRLCYFDGNEWVLTPT